MILRTLPALLMLLLLTAVLPATAAADSKGADSSTAGAKTEPSIENLVKACGFEYTSKGDNIFTLSVPGRQKQQHKVFVASYEGLVLIGTVVVTKPELKPETLTRLLRFNHDYDRIKVALDEDGDLVVRADLSQRVLDAPELKAAVEQVSASADEILGLLQPAAKQQ